MSSIAAFQLADFIFNDVQLSFSEGKHKSREISVDFEPKGEFISDTKQYMLTLVFTAFDDDKRSNPFIKIQCVGTFEFEGVTNKEEIPKFFYRNAIAILFPYIRAFVTSVTALANVTPMILPTYNLGDLEGQLRDNTSIR